MVGSISSNPLDLYTHAKTRTKEERRRRDESERRGQARTARGREGYDEIIRRRQVTTTTTNIFIEKRGLPASSRVTTWT